MSMTFATGDPPMSSNFCASNNPGDFSNDNQYKFGEIKWQWGSADSAGNFQPWTPLPQDINIPWISDQTFEIQPITIGQLRLNPATGLIEMYDGMKWVEYGTPIKPPPGIEQPPPAADDFELGGAL